MSRIALHPGLAPMEMGCIRPAQQGLARTMSDEPKNSGVTVNLRGCAGLEWKEEPYRHRQQAFGDYKLYSGYSLNPVS